MSGFLCIYFRVKIGRKGFNMANIARKKEKGKSLQNTVLDAIENFYKYGLIDKETYKVNKKIWR